MDTSYDPQSIERRWAQYWDDGHFAMPSGRGQAYSILLPPPNVTGSLHMGHGFQQTLMDALIRKHRMQGRNTLWQGGTDHAGIATQVVVEQQLAQEGRSRHDLGRDAFTQRVWQWCDQSSHTILQQMHRLGVSIDWTRAHFSMDEGIAEATAEAFRILYDDGLIYRGKRLVNWDPVLKTAIADLEVDNVEEDGHIWHIVYPFAEGTGGLTVATTRPETLLGDTAVAVHPDDARYQQHIGKMLRLPLTHRLIPIIADESVDPEFATGCVKITPGHDFNDYEVGQRHDLPILSIFTAEGRLNESVPDQYGGLDCMTARQRVVADLQAAHLLERVDAHRHKVPHGDRSGAVIEPMLTDQWYVKTKALAEPAIAALKNNDFCFVPSHWGDIYLQWLDDIQDWCISRQLWWGHRIPVWYDAEHNVYIGRHESAVREHYQLPKELALTQDKDVLDTWFTAALWPFSSLGWPQSLQPEKDDTSVFYPSAVLVTGFDIIFFWVARMVMMGLKIMGQVPFKAVYVTGLIRDAHGQKMSKSKGNVIDPIDLIDGIDLDHLIKKRTTALLQPQLASNIEKTTRREFPSGMAAHGTDALRFTFCALATPGRDIHFDHGRLSGYQNFCNKLWNAARYVLMNTENQVQPTDSSPPITCVDRWIISRLQRCIGTVDQHFQQYRFDRLAQTLYEFTWNEYCDWYLEFAKPVLTDNQAADEQQRASTRYTLLYVLETLLRLMHPIMPFITEEIWQKVAAVLGRPSGQTIMQQVYPQYDPAQLDPEAEETVSWLQQMVTQLRAVRHSIHVPLSQSIRVILDRGSEQDCQYVRSQGSFLKNLARVQRLSWRHHAKAPLPISAKAVVGELDLYIPLEGLMDQQTELHRLEKEIKKLRIEQKKSEQKLNNPHFIDKAPTSVVQQEKERLAQWKQRLAALEEHYRRVQAW